MRESNQKTASRITNKSAPRFAVKRSVARSIKPVPTTNRNERANLALALMLGIRTCDRPTITPETLSKYMKYAGRRSAQTDQPERPKTVTVASERTAPANNP